VQGASVSADKIDFKMLNAYVDGELDLPQQAEVADAIAREPSLGRQVATLTRLKSEAAESIETLDLGWCLPQRQTQLSSRSLASAIGHLMATVGVSGMLVTFMLDG
jgi:anti-sigma factor RsiW